MEHDCLQVDNIKEVKDNIHELFNRSLPPWVRTLVISAIATLFGLLGSVWVHASQTYATKSDLKEVKGDIRETLKEILREVKRK